MKIKSQRDFVSGLIFTGLGVVCSLGALSRPLGSPGAPGPGFLPLALGLALALLGLMVLFTALAIETEGGDPLGPLDWRALAAVVLAVAGFASALPRLGVIGAVSLVVIVLSLAQPQRRWPDVLARAALFAALGWWLWRTGTPAGGLGSSGG